VTARLKLALGGLLVLSACMQPQPVRDKAYYANHSVERTAQIAECKKDPGELGKTANCLNASAAAANIESDRFWAGKKPKSRVTNPGSL
jgi:hypothetical protein